MIRVFLHIVLFLGIALNGFGQDTLFVEQPFNGNRVYSGYSDHISSTADLPSQIERHLAKYLDNILGDFGDNINFSHGQIVDVDGYFNEADPAELGWVVPHYDLNFTFQDSSIQVRNYYIRIELDSYGQVLKCNWPKKNYSTRNSFRSLVEILPYALAQAQSRGIIPRNYSVDLKYDLKSDRLRWVFMFQINEQNYTVLEISTFFPEVAEEYSITKSTSH